MLKRRIIPVELLMGGRLVKSVQFTGFRDVGDPVKSSQVYANQDADELVLLNVDRRARGCAEIVPYLTKVAETCFMPIAAGGGITSVDDAATLFNAGADKVVVNSAAYEDTSLLREIARRYGRQALVISIDVVTQDGAFQLFSDCGRRREPVELHQHIDAVVEAGAGELFLNSIGNDGRMNGYDLSLLGYVRARCDIPLIICGGAGNYAHLLDAFEHGADAVACGSLFNFGDNNPLRVKAFLKNRGVPVKRV